MSKASSLKRVVTFLAVAAAAVVTGIAVYCGVVTVQKPQEEAEKKPPAVLNAGYVKESPSVDGSQHDAAWKDAPETIVKVKGAPDLSLKAVYTDERVFIRSQFEDDKEGAIHHEWEYDGKRWNLMPNGDMVAFLWNMGNSLEGFNEKGWGILTFKEETKEEEWPFEYCKDCHGFHGTPLRRKPKKSPWPFLKVEEPTTDSLKQRADLWELSLGISCPYGKGLDWFLCPVPYQVELPKDWPTYYVFQFQPDIFVYQRPFIVNTARRTDEEKHIVDDYPVFQYKEGKDMNNTPFPYMTDMEPLNQDTIFKTGDKLPHVVYEEGVVWGGSGDDLDARAGWADGVWTVEVSRKLNTGHPDDDVIFRPRKETETRYYFATWLRTKGLLKAGKQAAISRPMVLEFQPKE